VQLNGDACSPASEVRAAETWTAPKGGSIQTPQVREQGFDFLHRREGIWSQVEDASHKIPQFAASSSRALLQALEHRAAVVCSSVLDIS
jgi:hypothetical protein